MRDQYVILFLFSILLSACSPGASTTKKTSGAGEALEFWSMIRSYPDGRIRSDQLLAEFTREQVGNGLRNEDPEWEAIGPKNIGGRTLCMAFHPENPSTVYVGSAGGGLWKSTTAGSGVEAWERVITGYPALSIGSIAIDPEDPDVMYVGTGEVYNYNAAEPGTVDRLTRGLYGFGMLKTTDGGASWSLIMDFANSDLTGIWKIVINPFRTATVYAATTEGLFRSYDAGENWEQIFPIDFAMDFELNPVDTNLMFVSYGGYQSPERGVYRSQDGGESFSLLGGLPDDYDGKTMLAISPSSPEILYASVAEPFSSIGLFRSANNGDTWTLVNTEDVARWQGWYSHDVAIHNEDPNLLIYGGIDVHRSENGGANLTQVTIWNSWFFGQVPVGGPEGPDYYVHADIHGLYFHPNLTNVAYAVTDGGIFISNDAGETWEGRNGGYQTQQFYSNFANSTTDPALGIGGMQDNSTAVYTGGDAWTRVIGGDGMCAAVHFEDDGIIYGSSQGLNVYRSFNLSPFSYLNIASADSEARCFNGPFELVPSFPDQMYAGAQRLHVSYNQGDSWQATSSDLIDEGNPILTIAVDPVDPNLVFVSTAPVIGDPGVFKTENGGSTWEELVNGLPDRVVTDIAISSEDETVVFASVSGFGTPHVYRTTDGGENWEALGEGQIPDVPASTILIDPLLPEHIFVGNDLGVYFSLDGGESWDSFSGNLPDAIYVMHLSISADRNLRAATHGNGVWQAPLPEMPNSTQSINLAAQAMGTPFPNPVVDDVTIPISLTNNGYLELWLQDALGRKIKKLASGNFGAGDHQLNLDLGTVPAGMYHCVLELANTRATQRLVIN